MCNIWQTFHIQCWLNMLQIYVYLRMIYDICLGNDYFLPIYLTTDHYTAYFSMYDIRLEAKSRWDFMVISVNRHNVFSAENNLIYDVRISISATFSRTEVREEKNPSALAREKPTWVACCIQESMQFQNLSIVYNCMKI